MEWLNKKCDVEDWLNKKCDAALDELYTKNNIGKSVKNR